MEYSNWPINVERINVLRKIILSYLEEYMLYHIEKEINSLVSLKKLLQEQNLRCLFKVLSKGLLLNVEQFVKSRKWMNQDNANSIKNITITSINMIPEDHEKQSFSGSEQDFGSKQVSSESLNVFETILLPEGGSKSGEDDETNQSEEWNNLRKNDNGFINDGMEYKPGLILGKLSFISLSLTSIKKILEKSQILSSSSTFENIV